MSHQQTDGGAQVTDESSPAGPKRVARPGWLAGWLAHHHACARGGTLKGAGVTPPASFQRAG